MPDRIPATADYEVQARLSWDTLIYTPGGLRGAFGSGTENAVKAFQSDNGLTADGIVGSNTYAKMKVAHIMRFDDRTGNWRDLSLGKKGDDVAQLQMRLIRREYLPGLGNSDWSAADGVFGSQTQAAVIAFQLDHGLPGTGTASTLTLQQLAYYP